jgi:hypothetical protein
MNLDDVTVKPMAGSAHLSWGAKVLSDDLQRKEEALAVLRSLPGPSVARLLEICAVYTFRTTRKSADRLLFAKLFKPREE